MSHLSNHLINALDFLPAARPHLKLLSLTGRFNGEFKMHAYNAATWRLPLFRGRVRCSNMAFHFWDATDDFSDAKMDLLFEGHRLYVHGGSGKFGAVPLTITGKHYFANTPLLATVRR